MTSDPSNYHREYSPYGSYSLFQCEESDVISVLKNSIDYTFVFFKCLLKTHQLRGRYSIDNTKILTTHKLGWIKCSFLKFSQLRDVVHRIRAPYLSHFET